MASDTLKVFGIEYDGVTSIKAKDENGDLKTYIRPEGTKIISDSGIVDVASFASASVSAGTATIPEVTITTNPTVSLNTATGLITASYAGTSNITPTIAEGYIKSGTQGSIATAGTITYQLTSQAAQTITPTESEQIAVSSGRYTIGSVKVAAISSTYVGTGVATKSGADLTVSDSSIIVPSGYYSSQVSKTISGGVATTPATTITVNPTFTIISSTGKLTASYNGSSNITPVVTSGYISTGTQGTVSTTGTSTYTLATQAAQTIVPNETQQTIASNVWLTGVQTINAISSNYVGSGIPTKSSADLTTSGSAVTVPVGYYSSQATTNIAGGTATTPAVTITTNPTFTIVSSTGKLTATYTGSSNVTPTVNAGYIATGTAGTVSTTGTSTYTLTTQAAQTITPTETSQTIASYRWLIGTQTIAAISSTYVGTGVAQKSAADLTAANSTVTVPSGYYSSQVTKNVSSGEAFTPAVTITKNPTFTFVSSTGKLTAAYTGSSNITPTVTAGYVATGTAGTVSTTGTSTYTLTTQAAQTITPTETAQTIASYRWLTGTQTIAAISSTYIGTGVAQKSAADLTANGSTVTVPVGYYSTQATKNVGAGTAKTPAATITTNPTVTLVSSTAKITASYTGSSSITPTVTAGYIATGTAGTVSTTGTSTITLTSQAAQTINTSTADQTVASYRWLTGTQTIKSVTTSNIAAANIKSGVVVKVGDANNASRISQVTGTYLAPTYMQSLAYRSIISSGATDFTTWIAGLTTVPSGQFAGQPFSGSFTFTNATAINAYAFASGHAAYSYGSFYYLSFPAATTIQSGAFYYNSKIARVSAENVTTIGGSAFARCYNITSFSFPNITTINPGTFSICSGISYAEFPKVTVIGNSAFTYCSSLAAINFASATSIGAYAFSRCNVLSYVYFASVSIINSHAFNLCSQLRAAWLPSAATISTYAFSSCYNLMHLMLSTASVVSLVNVNAFATTPISTYTTSIYSDIESNSLLGNTSLRGSIYVPSSLLTSYREATNWVSYSSRIVGYSWTNQLLSSYFTSATSTMYGVTITGSSTNRRLTLNGTATSSFDYIFYSPSNTNLTRKYLYIGWPAGVPTSYGYTNLILSSQANGRILSFTTSGGYAVVLPSISSVTKFLPAGGGMIQVESLPVISTFAYITLHINSGATFSNKSFYFYLWSLYT